MRILIIGCGDAGLSAAFAARRQDAEAEITIVSREDSYYPRCPLPYVVSGELKAKDLRQEFSQIFADTGIRVVLGEVEKLEEGKAIIGEKELPFDKAIIAVGAKAKTLSGTISLRTLEDAERISKRKGATVVGAGVLGCELAEMLKGQLVEREEEILPGFDFQFSRAARRILESKGVKIKTGSTEFSSDAVSAIGVEPRIELAESSGIEFVEFGIGVNERLETSMKGVYAAGDCISERCFFTGAEMHSYLGPQADRQGVIAGTNAAGGELHYKGTINQTVIKLDDTEFGITGLSLGQAERLGMEAFSVNIVVAQLPFYYGSKKTTLSMCFAGGNVVGLQAMGPKVDGLVNLASSMIESRRTIDDLITFSYCFSPKVCNSPHPFILCAEKAKNKIKNG